MAPYETTLSSKWPPSMQKNGCPARMQRPVRIGTLCTASLDMFHLKAGGVTTKGAVNFHICGPLWQTVGHTTLYSLRLASPTLPSRQRNSLLPRQVAHRLSKCFGPPLGIFRRPLWPLNELTFVGQNILLVHIPMNFLMDVLSLKAG